ncbi:MAG TPA: SDR family oxidoreductase, partial [Polyangiaceae bacterium]|nr:SDR family oxidoreductase [Polyangiaceae bacterium]
MTSVLVTGANRGLGLEFTKQYAESGCRVFATARDPGRAHELSQLARKLPHVSVHALDVRSSESVRELASSLRDEAIDILLCNAGVMGPKRQSVGQIDYTGMLETIDINALGPLRVAEAFVEQVARSERKLMVAITSGMGSISDSSGGSYAYRASKAALNMTFHNLALDLKGRGIIAFVINPGWVQTDMGGASAPLSPQQSIAAMRRVFDGMTMEQTGRFMNYQ